MSVQPALKFEAREGIRHTADRYRGRRASGTYQDLPVLPEPKQGGVSALCQPVQYGPEVQAVVTYLSQYQMLPYQQLKESLENFFQLSLSEGMVNNILRRGYRNLQQFGSQLHRVHFDSTESVTCYMHHPNRRTPAMKAMGILEGFNGYAVHDYRASYSRFAILNVLCDAHILRALIHAHEQHHQIWAQKLINCLLEAKQEADLAIAKRAETLDSSRIDYYDRRYSRILREGREELPTIPIPAAKTRGRTKQHKGKNLHDRLFYHKAEVLALVCDLTLPIDNNQGERDVRMAKVKREISGCFRSDEGADVFCRIRGYISTARKQGQNVLGLCGRAFTTEHTIPPLPGQAEYHIQLLLE